MKDTIYAYLYWAALAAALHYGLGSFVDWDKMNQAAHEYSLFIFLKAITVLWDFRFIFIFLAVMFIISFLHGIINRRKS